MDLKRKVIRQSGIYVISNAATYLISFVGGVILARLLEPKDFGIIALVLAVIEFSSIPFAFSFKTTFIERQMNNKNEISILSTLSFGIGVLYFFLLIVVGIVVFLINNTQFAAMFICYGFSTALAMISANLFTALLEFEFEYKYISFSQVMGAILSPLISIILALNGFGVWSLAISYLSMNVLSFLLLWNFSRWKPIFSFDVGAAREFIRPGFAIMVARGLEVFVTKIDKLFLGVKFNKAELGLYSRAYNLAELGHYFVSPAIVTMALPTYSRLKSDEKKLLETVKIVNYLIPRIIIPVVVLFAIFPKFFVVLIYGKKWALTALPLQILSPYILLLPIFENLKQFHYSIGKATTVLKVRVFQSLSLLVSIIVLSQLFGWYGVAIGIDVSILVGVLAFNYFLSSNSVDIYLLSIIKYPFVYTLLSFVIMNIVNYLWENTFSFINILFFIGLILIFYLGLLVIEKEKFVYSLDFFLADNKIYSRVKSALRISNNYKY